MTTVCDSDVSANIDTTISSNLVFDLESPVDMLRTAFGCLSRSRRSGTDGGPTISEGEKWATDIVVLSGTEHSIADDGREECFDKRKPSYESVGHV